MQLKQDVRRKHICTWEISDCYWPTNKDVYYERTCDSCEKVQTGLVTNPDTIPMSLRAYADTEWTDGKLSERLNKKHA